MTPSNIVTLSIYRLINSVWKINHTRMNTLMAVAHPISKWMLIWIRKLLLKRCAFLYCWSEWYISALNLIYCGWGHVVFSLAFLYGLILRVYINVNETIFYSILYGGIGCHLFSLVEFLGYLRVEIILYLHFILWHLLSNHFFYVFELTIG